MHRALRVGLHLSAFLLGTFGVVLALGVLVAIGLLAAGGSPDRPEDLLDSGVLGLLSIVQIVAVSAVAVVLAAAFPTDAERPPPAAPPADAPAAPREGPPAAADPPPPLVPARPVLRARLAAAFPTGLAPAHLAAAFVGGTIVWTLPTWVAEHLTDLVDLGSMSSLELVSEGLRDPDPLGRFVLVVAVTVTAPLFEELVFRGYVWRVIDWGYGGRAAAIGSTLLFAAYHLDPVQALGLLPTAAFLGWLRLRSGSMLPGMLAHFVNNGIAVLASWTWPEESRVPLWLALFGAGGTLALCALTDRFAAAPRRPAAS